MTNAIVSKEAEAWYSSPTQRINYSNAFTSFDKANSTKDAYFSDWEDFCSWCLQNGHSYLPANPESVADYLADRATNKWIGPQGRQRKLAEKQPLKWNSLQRRLAAISKVHKNCGQPFERSHSAISKTLDGMKRRLSMERPQQIIECRKDPLIIEDIRGMVESLPRTLAGVRDQALILVGFAGALRRSELATIKFEHVKLLNEGLEIFLPWTKTGPRTVRIPYGSNPLTCPVRALKEWIEKAQLEQIVENEIKAQESFPDSKRYLPAIFRAINKHNQVQSKALTGAAIALIIKRNSYLIEKVEQRKKNKEWPNYGGHSLRAGFATTAARAGVAEHLGMEQGGWKKSDTWKKYIRESNKWKNNAANQLGL
jgi:integrase